MLKKLKNGVENIYCLYLALEYLAPTTIQYPIKCSVNVDRSAVNVNGYIFQLAGRSDFHQERSKEAS